MVTDTETRELIEVIVLLGGQLAAYLKARAAEIRAENAERQSAHAATQAQAAGTRAEDAKGQAELAHAATLINSDRLRRMENGGTTEKIRGYLAAVGLYKDPALTQGVGDIQDTPDDSANTTMAQEAIPNVRPDSNKPGSTAALNTDSNNGGQGAPGPVVRGNPW